MADQQSNTPEEPKGHEHRDWAGERRDRELIRACVESGLSIDFVMLVSRHGPRVFSLIEKLAALDAGQVNALLRNE